MFKELRRIDKKLDNNETIKLLETERRGVLSVLCDNGYPYGVPINYIYNKEENKIYFHGSKEGQKADSIKKCDKVCFTVYGNQTIKQENWAPYLQSAVAFGRCHIIEDKQRTIELVKSFARKYYPNEELIDKEIALTGKVVTIYEIEIEYITGKQIQEK